MSGIAEKQRSGLLLNVISIIGLTLGLDEEYLVKLNDHSSEAETFCKAFRMLKKYIIYSLIFHSASCQVVSRVHAEAVCALLMSKVFLIQKKTTKRVRVSGWKVIQVGDENDCGKLTLIFFDVIDFVTLTLLFSQPVSALQIMTKSGEWKWVKHAENAIVSLPVPSSSSATIKNSLGGQYRWYNWVPLRRLLPIHHSPRSSTSGRPKRSTSRWSYLFRNSAWQYWA